MGPRNTFSGRLRALRELAELDTRELDRLAKRGEGHVSMIETGRRVNPELATVKALADVLGCSLGWLLAGEGEAPTAGEVKAAVNRADPDGTKRLPHHAPAPAPHTARRRAPSRPRHELHVDTGGDFSQAPRLGAVG